MSRELSRKLCDRIGPISQGALQAGPRTIGAGLHILVPSDDLRATSCRVGFDSRRLRLEPQAGSPLLARADGAVSDERLHATIERGTLHMRSRTMNNRSVAELLYFDTIKWTFDDIKACLQYFKQCIEEWKDLMALAQRGSLSSMHWTKSRFRNDSVREHSDDEPPTPVHPTPSQIQLHPRLGKVDFKSDFGSATT